ncbi:MFS transporter [Jatrophihabitans sp.]|uniref:MFS transporter n=1 Tax=Jatrophihabitans sp. TaxID=1932789 RepID=UPI0030C7395A|nr:transporter [Jatrophihabitans sp.]
MTTPHNRSAAATAATSGWRRLLPQNRATLVLVVILTCQLMVVLDATIVNIALQDIRNDLHFSASNLSWVVNAYSLTFGGLLLLGARAGDLLGRRSVFLTGLSLFTAASFLGGFAQNPAELLTARAIQGIGGALASPTALALLMTMFPQGRERTRAIGLYTAVSIGGSALGLIAGGMLSEWASWRWVFFVNVPIGIAAVAVARFVLPQSDRSTGRFDLAGAITSTLGMATLVYGFVNAGTSGWADVETIGSFAIGIVLMAAFVFTELRAESPITPLHLFADRNRSSSYLARLFLVAGMMGMFFFLTQFLRGVLGYSDLKTGFAFVPLTLAVFTSSQLSSRVLVERFGGRRLMIIGASMSTLGMLWLTQLGESSSYLSLVGPLVIFGFGNGLAFVPLTTTAIDGVAPKDAGAASGLVNVMQQVGGALGLAVLVTVFGSASTHATNSAPAGLTAEALYRHVYTYAADKAFWTAEVFLIATLLLVTFAIRPRVTRAYDAVEDAAMENELALEF